MSGSTSPSLALSPAERARVDQVDRLFASGPAGIPELVGLLGDPSWTVRRAVVGALGAAGDLALPTLVGHLQSARSSEAVIAATVDALVGSSGAVEAALVPLSEHADPAVLADVAQILGRRQHPASVPVLSRLAEHANDNVAVAAIEALGRVGGRAAVESLVAAVASGNFFRTFPAIDVLGRSGDPRAVGPLAGLLGDRHFSLEAARALGRTGDKGAVAPLARLLAAPSNTDVRVAAVALGELRERFGQHFGTRTPVEEALRRAVDPRLAARRLGQALAGADLSEKVAISVVLGILDEETAVPILTALLGDDGGVASAAAEALKNLGRRSDAAVIDLLRTSDSAQRKRLLPLVTRADSAHELVACLGDPDAEVRAATCESLARIGDPTVARVLFERLADSSPLVVQAAVAAIQALGSDETEPLALSAARSESSAVRRWALRILAYFGYPSALEVCLAAIEDPEPRVRDSAIAGLPFLEDPRAREALLAAARRPVAKVRAAAVRALGQVPGDARVPAALLRALGDEDPWVRYYACQALGKLGVQPAVDAVARLIGDEAGQVRVAAVEALAHFDTPVARDVLTRAAASDDADVRRAALVGLGISRAVEALPVLVEAAESTDVATRLVALGALASFDHPAVVPPLRRGARDEDETVRNAAISYLAGRRDRESTAALIELAKVAINSRQVLEALAVPSRDRIAAILAGLEGSDDELAPLLTAALARMRRPEANVALVDAMSLPNVAARKAAASTLAGVGTAEALEALRTAAREDPDPEVRRICGVVIA
jgi:HEAT repeat protein